jgi:dihydrofolate reductase
MRKLIVSEFVSLDGVMQAPGGVDEDRDGGFKHGGWTMPYWHDEIWAHHYVPLLKDVDALLLGRRTYVTHAEAFEPNPANDPFGPVKKYVVSRTLEKPIWRDTTIIRDNVLDAVWQLKEAPGKNIFIDGSSQLVHTLLEHGLIDELHLLVYPLTLGGGKRLLPAGVHSKFRLLASRAYPTGVVGLHYAKGD